MRSHRPVRILIAVGEVLATVVLGWLAWWCWHRGVIITARQDVQLSRIDGRWWAAATGVATLAGILAIDAGRRVALAGRPTRQRGGAADPVSLSAGHADPT